MVELLTYQDPFLQGYQRTYDALSELREHFHRSGRFDDSNAKLDEVAKLFAVYLAFKTGKIREFPKPESPAFVSELQSAFSETAALPQYRLGDDNSIFGTQPALAIRPGDEAVASDIVKLVCQGIDLAFESHNYHRPFDIVNEAFGHFVRDNFRSNIEDAQYMTPPEVTDFMAEIVLHDVLVEDGSQNKLGASLTVLDPACGVGSFLGAVYRLVRGNEQFSVNQLGLFGQDKIERMVRLATLNLELFDVCVHRITLGNSLALGSPIDHLNGQVDIILTNPPFGARFDQGYLEEVCGSNTPFFSNRRRPSASVCSELLFLDRGLRLLKEGGRMLIVVPDGVVSAKGTYALFRQNLARTVTLRAVVELPSTTFAQAGTRTKTSILYLQKKRASRNASVFMGVSNHLGFQVSSRKGVQIKKLIGENDLLDVSASYIKHNSVEIADAPQVLSSSPSCVVVPQPIVFQGSWTPMHYSSARLESIMQLNGDGDFQMVRLGDLVEFCSRTRKPEHWRDGWAFVSVLHIIGDGLVNVGRVFDYAPVTPGLQTFPGEILISRINPRIPRVCITPDFGVKTLCSSEFEIMQAKEPAMAYMLAYILQTDVVQNQVRNLTSGTSASHNRIRTAELAAVQIPIAKYGTKKYFLLDSLASKYKSVLNSLTTNVATVAELRRQEKEIFTNSSQFSDN